MNLSADHYKSIEELSYRLIPPTLIAINLEVDETDFLEELRTPGTEIRKAFYKGYLKIMIETREAIIQTAKNGSNPAQTELIKFIKEINHSLPYE
jgi:hypothetical protein